ncbi:hypothetical protein H4R33_001148 [Dimargaris cristalligena]|uniref:Metallo-dependent phosphatase-like protein n=1 Tax=Dimargaris cristalligena TaxID=215637 RepID=A0A4P9ZT68_9FUNG|nr:hypothetical protein H4R33_001148 [Dimargaris cristalligena]RKP36021.1 Metallo-dependent phosphatase-like protein [Dimargaris cristalligena]|eukprot:RKP36021.1 Metallo-dependent phosphatase-like protein [Dimargaris cristalligena]
MYHPSFAALLTLGGLAVLVHAAPAPLNSITISQVNLVSSDKPTKKADLSTAPVTPVYLPIQKPLRFISRWGRDDVKIYERLPVPTTTQRVLIVGDIHGMFQPFAALIKAMHYNPMTDLLILLGDLINKGPEPHKVVEHARKLGAKCVRGNHEDRFFFERHRRNNDLPIPEKLDLFPETVRQLTEEDITYLAGCSTVIHLTQSYGPLGEIIAVHAGLQVTRSLDAQKADRVLNLPEIIDWSTYDRTFATRLWQDDWEQAVDPDRPRTVFYGHDDDQGLQIRPHSKGIDTSCFRGNQLTVYELPATKLTSVSCAPDSDYSPVVREDETVHFH